MAQQHDGSDTRRRPTTEGADGGPTIGKAARSKATLKEAARGVFARDGYLKARIIDITTEAGCSLGSFYNHFENKQELLRELLDDFWVEVNERTLLPFRLRLPAPEASREAIRAFWFTYKEYLPELTAVMQASMVDDEFLYQWLRIRNSGIGSIRKGIIAAQREGFCPGIDPALASAALSSMLEHSCQTWLNQVGDAPVVEDEEAIETLWTLWYHAVYWRGNGG